MEIGLHVVRLDITLAGPSSDAYRVLSLGALAFAQSTSSHAIWPQGSSVSSGGLWVAESDENEVNSDFRSTEVLDDFVRSTGSSGTLSMAFFSISVK